MNTKESLTFTDFLEENQKKVPAEIFFKKSGDFLFFQQAFAGLEILGVHILRFDQWFYAIYHGARRVGYIYDDDHYNLDEQKTIVENYIPENANHLQDFVVKYTEKIDYHKCRNDTYKIVGEITGKELIQKVKYKTK